MMSEHRFENRVFVAAVLLVAILVGLAIVMRSDEGEIACTADAMICPDGTAVGRTGPNCEFSECSKIDASWASFTDPESGASIRYPETLSYKYISIVDWPPRVAISEDPFSCVEAGREIDRAGVSERKMIGGREYCATRESEGAAGSVYTNYAYASPVDGGTAILTFSLRAVQCLNYDDPQRSECLAEREAFDLGPTIAKMMESITI